ncbi:glutathione S-transferase family protein [Ramlibacter albus]|uniref:Glutathione S-transferase family protein n=1 Tax=Ramlibacter albus TaxID=2079448 RepID=A0A923M3Z0_9BURK|nr:glutathione S-transferase family protein [Ramlibacter albus]MBC5763473.1 glutathione S-transferase family protein [Ramlibacter albus]
MPTLYYYPSTAAMIPHIVLEEIGAPYERVLVDRTKDAHKSADYLRMNPNGLLPVWRDGELVLYETAAIVLHLCDTNPKAQLAPALGTAQRAHFYKWLAWLTNTLQATLIVYFYPDRWVKEGDAAAAAEVKLQAQRKVLAQLRQLDDELARTGGPWFAGERYSALDAYVFTLCRWTRNFDTGKARDFPNLGPYLQRMLERPAVKRVFDIEALKPPYV